jgi:hypothetical protein
MSIFTFIGHLFEGLFNAAKKAYNGLTPEQQTALQQGSGLVAIINNMITATPAEVRAAIQAKFPELDEKKLEEGLFGVAKAFHITELTSLDDVIVAIQKHLESLQGNLWEVASHAAASALAIIFAPPETKFAAIASLLEWVYQHFIKKSIPDTSHPNEG